MINLKLSLLNWTKAAVDGLVCIETINCHDDWLVLLVWLNLSTVLVSVLNGIPSLPLVEDLFDLVVPVEAFLPLQILFVD